jgi:hypothetical protein
VPGTDFNPTDIVNEKAKRTLAMIVAAGCIGAYNLFRPTAIATHELQEKCGKDAAEVVTKMTKRVPLTEPKTCGTS